MNVTVSRIHYSTINCTVSPSICPLHQLRLSSLRIRNPSHRFRAKSSLVIEKQDGQVVSDEETPSQPLSESVSRRLILLRHANSSWENRSLRGIYQWQSLKTFCFVMVFSFGKYEHSHFGIGNKNVLLSSGTIYEFLHFFFLSFGLCRT